jgi:hypothetical protein
MAVLTRMTPARKDKDLVVFVSLVIAALGAAIIPSCRQRAWLGRLFVLLALTPFNRSHDGATLIFDHSLQST